MLVESAVAFQQLKMFNLNCDTFTELISASYTTLITGIVLAEYIMIYLYLFFSSYTETQVKERWKFKNVRFKTWRVHILPPIST